MANNNGSLHIFFFPFPAHGHMMPCVDMAILFAAKGVRTTIITTPLNAPIISKAIEKTKTYQTKEINVQTIKFPSAETGLPEGCEHVNSLPSLDLWLAFHKATRLLQEPFEQLLLHQHPNCVVADMFFPWVTDSTTKSGIPRLVFHGMSFFSLCAYEVMRLYEPYNNTSFDSELFVLPNFPGEIKMTRLQVGNFYRKDDVEAKRFWKQIHESEVRSYGVIVNSFYELEKDYADHYRKEFGRKAWPIGPLSLRNNDKVPKTCRGKDEHECLKWLDTKTNGSVVYACFGSMTKFPDSQLREIALGLEASGQEFMWVVGKRNEGKEEWLPEGFEKRMEGKGLIIRGWAPQVLILEHEAVGAFVTHCGWNSTLEGVVAGVPMITWPVSAEQFYNEKLVSEVLKIGVPVGVRKWGHFVGDKDVAIKSDALEMAVKRVLAEEKAEGMRNRAKLFAHMARRAVEEAGSSDSNFDALVQELVSLSH
ncbi:unnamed protein product [Sphenostylis stenocarpa]|uniref:Glycosyltransferase n=1 Tax=Sphenostylis stenocarpa TaxID=92480 RepID=A0AA86S259_9FABA|nr:unnamed protein product [Sphenostylis stenocarpa]